MQEGSFGSACAHRERSTTISRVSWSSRGRRPEPDPDASVLYAAAAPLRGQQDGV